MEFNTDETIFPNHVLSSGPIFDRTTLVGFYVIRKMHCINFEGGVCVCVFYVVIWKERQAPATGLEPTLTKLPNKYTVQY